jgi:hypothetical protein
MWRRHYAGERQGLSNAPRNQSILSFVACGIVAFMPHSERIRRDALFFANDWPKRAFEFQSIV